MLKTFFKITIKHTKSIGCTCSFLEFVSNKEPYSNFMFLSYQMSFFNVVLIDSKLGRG